MVPSQSRSRLPKPSSMPAPVWLAIAAEGVASPVTVGVKDESTSVVKAAWDRPVGARVKARPPGRSLISVNRFTVAGSWPSLQSHMVPSSSRGSLRLAQCPAVRLAHRVSFHRMRCAWSPNSAHRAQPASPAKSWRRCRTGTARLSPRSCAGYRRDGEDSITGRGTIEARQPTDTCVEGMVVAGTRRRFRNVAWFTAPAGQPTPGPVITVASGISSLFSSRHAPAAVDQRAGSGVQHGSAESARSQAPGRHRRVFNARERVSAWSGHAARRSRCRRKLEK